MILCCPLLSILSDRYIHLIHHFSVLSYRLKLLLDALNFKLHQLPGYTTSGALQNIIVGCLEKPLGSKMFVSFWWVWLHFSQIAFVFFTFGLWRSTFARRSGHTYGPPGHRRCVLFVDDLNMPYVGSRVEDEPWQLKHAETDLQSVLQRISRERFSASLIPREVDDYDTQGAIMLLTQVTIWYYLSWLV